MHRKRYRMWPNYCIRLIDPSDQTISCKRWEFSIRWHNNINVEMPFTRIQILFSRRRCSLHHHPQILCFYVFCGFPSRIWCNFWSIPPHPLCLRIWTGKYLLNRNQVTPTATAQGHTFRPDMYVPPLCHHKNLSVKLDWSALTYTID